MSHDHTELIARLRSIQSPHCQHAADALIAQAAEISALHTEIDACHKRILALIAEVSE
jgi:hypothetical protein